MEYGVKIIGTGSYLPSKILTNADLEKIVDTSDEWITTRTGVKERRISAPEEASSDLACNAAKIALNESKTDPAEIDLIVVATITPDMLFPSTACVVQEKLGAKNAAAFDLSAACSGFIYALAVGCNFIRNGMYKKVLVIASEALSKITDWQDRSTCVLLGDGAGAVVLQQTDKKDDHFLSFYLAADGKYGDLLNMPAGGSRIPATIESVNQRLHYLKMKGNEVFKIAVHSMMDAVKKAAELCKLPFDEIKLFIPHQANLRIINAIAERMNIPTERVFLNIHKYGNMSAATTAVGLDEAIKQKRIVKNDVVELVTFGSGFTSAACVIRL